MTTQKQGRPLGRPKMKADGQPTNELILEAATRLFLAQGFQKVSIDDIAKEAGMTKASVYYYYSAKAELFKEAMIALMSRVRERIIQLFAADKPLYERLYDITAAHLRATTTIDLEGFIRESHASLSREQIQEIKAAEENMYNSIEEAFLAAIQAGEIPEIHAKFAAHSYIALVEAGGYKLPDGSSLFPSVEQTAENIMKVFWRGFFGGILPSE